jgi:hypothetical protein
VAADLFQETLSGMRFDRAIVAGSQQHPLLPSTIARVTDALVDCQPSGSFCNENLSSVNKQAATVLHPRSAETHTHTGTFAN